MKRVVYSDGSATELPNEIAELEPYIDTLQYYAKGAFIKDYAPTNTPIVVQVIASELKLCVFFEV
jgi:hypothetical protein